MVSTLKCTFSVYGLSSLKTSFGDRNSSVFMGRSLSRFVSPPNFNLSDRLKVSSHGEVLT